MNYRMVQYQNKNLNVSRTYLEKHLYGEDAGEPVVELPQELVPVAVHVDWILDKDSLRSSRVFYTNV